MYPLRETVVCVQRPLASACGLSVQAVGWDHHEDEVRQVLFPFLVQLMEIQALELLISIHALITDMIKVHLNQPFICFFSVVVYLNLSIQFTKSLTIKPPSL